MPSPIIARAGEVLATLLHQGVGADEVPVLIDALDDEDIPILLLVDTPAPAAEPAESADTPNQLDDATPPTPEAAPEVIAAPAPDADLDEHLVRELSRRIEARLSAELPAIIAATVRDFLAEHNSRKDL